MPQEIPGPLNAKSASAAIRVSPELTRKVAQLSKLSLTDEEVSTFTPQLEQILGYVAQLSEIPAEIFAQIEPLICPLSPGKLDDRSTSAETRWRDDVAIVFPRDEEGVSRVVACASESVDGAFKVPPIL